jgi:tRNA (adenine57-N1/adenine58-N1)-methyltransferase
MNQLEKLTMALVENEFTDIESTEHIIRNIEAREGKTRHSFQGIGHTTYLCFARKAFFDKTKAKVTKAKVTKAKVTKAKVTKAKATKKSPKN